MKVAITGATGWIGSGVLSQLVGDSPVTSILALSRRKLSISSPKLSTLVKAEFTNYTPVELEQLKDCDTMLWSATSLDSTLLIADCCAKVYGQWCIQSVKRREGESPARLSAHLSRFSLTSSAKSHYSTSIHLDRRSSSLSGSTGEIMVFE